MLTLFHDLQNVYIYKFCCKNIDIVAFCIKCKFATSALGNVICLHHKYTENVNIFTNDSTFVNRFPWWQWFMDDANNVEEECRISDSVCEKLSPSDYNPDDQQTINTDIGLIPEEDNQQPASTFIPIKVKFINSKKTIL